MKRITAAIIAVSMLLAMAACSSGSGAGSEPASQAETSSAADSSGQSGEEASSEAADENGLTKEKYDTMTSEDLLARIKDISSVTADEYKDLIMTYRFVDIVDDEEQVNYMGLAENITDEALKGIEYSARPDSGDYIGDLLASEYPQVRGYGLSMMSSLFGVSDNNLELAKELLKTEEDNYVLYCAIDALSNELKKDPSIAEFAFRMADSENPKLRFRAAIAIGNTWSQGVDGTVDKIIGMMNDENETVRAEACQRAGKLGDEKVIDPLVEVLNDESTPTSVQRGCLDGLLTLWYDYPFHEQTSEKAYKASMDYYKATPRTDDRPYWSAVSLLSSKADTKYDDWKAKATYFDTEDLYNTMSDIIKDENANWMARTSAIKVIKVHCTEQQFTDLKAVIDGLSDDKAHFVQDAYETAASEE